MAPGSGTEDQVVVLQDEASGVLHDARSQQVGHSELEPSLAADAALVVSDSPAQVAAYDPPNVLIDSGVDERLTHTGAVLAGEVPVPEDTRMFFSVGLAGAEAWLRDAAGRSA